MEKSGGSVINVDTKLEYKMKLKFIIGDWIVCGGGNPCRVLKAEPSEYEFVSTVGIQYKKPVNVVEQDYRHWDFQKDAKKGQLLYTMGGCFGAENRDILFMYSHTEDRSYLDEPCVIHYCFLTSEGFKVNNGQSYMGLVSENIKRGIRPATFEERTKFFTEMAISGYIWDYSSESVVKSPAGFEESINKLDELCKEYQQIYPKQSPKYQDFEKIRTRLRSLVKKAAK